MIRFSEIQRRITQRFSIEELEARLRPGEPKCREGAWSGYSSGGFLAPDEKLMEVVRADYDTLCSLGKSYSEMAQLAAGVLEEAQRKSYEPDDAFTERARDTVIPSNARNSYGKRFILMPMSSNGFQSCPWECGEEDEFGYPPWGSGHVYVLETGKGNDLVDNLEKWCENRRKILRNNELPQEEIDKRYREFESTFKRSFGIEFGDWACIYPLAFTVITDLTPHLIASHYFFEGESSYRTDPKKLVQIAGKK